MSLTETIHHLQNLLSGMIKDLGKVQRGNKAASQRVRTGSIKLEKVAKAFRKESIQTEKSAKFKKKLGRRSKSKKKKRLKSSS